ncbi:MAG: hypothetical protein IPH37_10095 [Burkholderiales bacterium]|nr:hypothetical protein [Burkholderiales bacterium]
MDSYPGLLAQVLTNLTMNAITHAFARPNSRAALGVGGLRGRRGFNRFQ